MKRKTGIKTVWITGDQCSKNNTALIAADNANSVILMIESIARGNMLKYHKKKLVLIYSCMRHFAEELRQDGWEVDYHREAPDFRSALNEHIERYKPQSFLFMEQSEYGASEKLAKMIGNIDVQVTPHCNFISTAAEFEKLHKSPDSRVTMESFYHVMRKKTGILMDGEQPRGGAWNFDKSNRQPPGKDLKTHALKRFPPDRITLDVITMVEKYFAEHPGTTDDWHYAVTREDAQLAAADFFDHRLDEFGPHQDAMLHGKPFLNHSVLSPYVNVCLLHPLELCREAESRLLRNEAQLASVEGFVRQLIGWREFVWRVYWRMMPEMKSKNGLNATEPLPDFFWTGDTRMRCLKDAIDTTIQHGYAHHIVRLMLLGNFALVAGLDPLETNNWFASMYIDGYDWVMVPNVIGMSLHADGGYVGTKPYAASANYINKMSDYCRKCPYDPKSATGDDACPFNALYWDFLMRNEETFAQNHRMSMIMKGLSAKSGDWRYGISNKADQLRESGWK
jgi:deoxyribodipyrimidine photolyase-related protein